VNFDSVRLSRFMLLSLVVTWSSFADLQVHV